MSKDKFPVIQAALDFVDTERALKLAAEAASGGAEWLEAGTPLIKSEGLNAVRVLRENFPDKTIIADMKTMDAGRGEVEAAAKAGADIVVVLGAASDTTIKQSIEAGKNYGCKIYVDTINLADPVKRAKEAESWGADYVGVHLPIDDQMAGKDILKTLKDVAGAVNIPVAVAGGINSESAPKMVEAGASILIVGGALTKADNATEATALIKKAVDQKQGIASNLFKRGGSENLRQIFEKVSSCNLSDAMHRGGVIEGVKTFTPGLKAVGKAFTVRSLPGDWAKPVEAIDEANEGDIIVVDTGGIGPAVWGGCATESAMTKKLGGVIVYGYIRDLDEIEKCNIPVFACGAMPNAGEPKGYGEIGGTVKIGGRVISTGDWIVADDSGAVSIEKTKAVEYANRAQDVYEMEKRLKAEIKAGSTLGKIVQLKKWEKK